MPQAGDRFDDFTLRRELGRGAMGVVWEAHQASLDRLVALKILNEGVAADPVWVARFKAEAAQAARLAHPGILPVYAVGETRGLHWFAMEIVEGEDLARRLATRGPLPFDEAARYVREAALALGHAHGRGVIHRDIKPANLMLRSDGRVVLTDFGLSKERGSGGLTTTGLLVGTPYYMSPELVAGDTSKVGPSADIYGLGVTLYELVTGAPPFMAENAAALIRLIADAEPEPPSKRRPGLPRDLETIALTCLAKRPEKRYASAEDLAQDLERFLAHEPITRRRPGVLERVGRFAAKNRLVVSVAVGALLVVAGVSVLFRKEIAERESAYQEQIDRLLREADDLMEQGDEEQAEALHAQVARLASKDAETAQAVAASLARDLVADLRAGRPLRAEYQKQIQGWAAAAPAHLTLATDVPVQVVGSLAGDAEAARPRPLTLDGRELTAGHWRLHVSAPGRLRTVVTLLASPGLRGTLRVELPRDDDANEGLLSYGGAWFPHSDPARAAGADGLEHVQPAYFLDEERVTARAYSAFLAAQPAAQRATLTPASWVLRAPTGAALDAPILGLTRAQAEAFATSQGKRLPTDLELAQAAAPARLQGLRREVLTAARADGAKPRPNDVKVRLKAALGKASASLERAEGLAGWDGRAEMAVTAVGERAGQEAPWPRALQEPATDTGSRPPMAAPSRGGRSGTRPRETLERLSEDVALRLAR